MYELLSDVTTVPVSADSLMRVQTGMNKVRISVGDHISEPSEVYIATGDTGSGLETYIVFFMIEPAFHVVYGYDKNPYDPAGVDEAIEEAVNFVEEMGSILEEVPWNTMSPEQRTAWAGKEALYREPATLDPELLEVADEIKSDELLEVIEEDAVDSKPEGIEEGELEPRAQEDDEHEPSEDDSEEEDRSSEDDVVVAEGDFDELLKQAFLKPEVVKKTQRRKQRAADAEESEEEPGSVEAEVPDVEIEIEAAAFENDLGTEDAAKDPIVQDADFPSGVKVPEETPTAPPASLKSYEDAAGVETTISPDEKTMLSVVRFLSRF
jgi:hypothetical protein